MTVPTLETFSRLELCESRLRKNEEARRRLLFKMLRCYRRTTSARRQVEAERALRIEAERNAAKFHALLIAERIKHLPARGNND